jgi:hypothetical protein
VNSPLASEAPGHAFISYVREDRMLVDRLQGILEAAGIRVWRDTADLWPGQDWEIEIRRAINTNSLAFIACFSENNQRRPKSYQNKELILAVEQMRLRPPGQAWLIPVRFSDCDMPEFDLGPGRTLSSLQCVDLFGGSWELGTARLTAAVLRILGESRARLHTGPETSLNAGPWHFDNAKSVTVVCSVLPLQAQGPFTDPSNPNYDGIYRFADLGALFELYGHLRAANPSIQVNLIDQFEFRPPHFASDLIVLGAAGWSGTMRAVQDRLHVPVRPIEDSRCPVGEVFSVEMDGHERRYLPIFQESQHDSILKEDVALFVHAINPFNRKRTISLCDGTCFAGIYGVVRALTDPDFRDRNAEYLAGRFGGSESFLILTRVQVESGPVVLTPDWTLPENRLFEWPPGEGYSRSP